MHLISAHLRFFLEPAIKFRGRDYIDVAGLQSGEGWTFDPYKKEQKTPFSTPLAARQAVEFPLALYGRTPVKPAINQEGPYDHPIENDRVPLPPRKAGYWSFLSGAPGFTYGCFGVWNWGVPIAWFPCYDFPAAVDLPSAAQMTHLAEFFGAIPWWTLEPRHELVQNPSDDPLRKIVLAKSPEGDLAVAYLPDNAVATIDMQACGVFTSRVRTTLRPSRTGTTRRSGYRSSTTRSITATSRRTMAPWVKSITITSSGTAPKYGSMARGRSTM